MANKEYKEMLCDRYLYLKQPVNIKRTDIVPIVRYSWPNSFGRKDKNMKAIQQRGWNPLTYNLLLDDEVAATKFGTDNLSNILHDIPSFDPVPKTVITNSQVSALSEISNVSEHVQPSSSPDNSSSDVNLSQGYSGDVMVSIIQYALK